MTPPYYVLKGLIPARIGGGKGLTKSLTTPSTYRTQTTYKHRQYGSTSLDGRFGQATEKPKNGIIISVIVTIALVFIPSLHQCVYGITLLSYYDENGNCFNVYQNERYNMFMSYPCTWTERIAPVPGVESILYSPLESPQDIYRENLGIIVQSLPTQNISSNALLDIYARHTVDNYSTQPVNFHLLSSEPMNLFPSIPAHKLIYTLVRDSATIQVMDIYTILDGNVFLFTYSAESDQPFYKYIPAVENMLSTLEIGNNKVSSMSPLNVPFG